MNKITVFKSGREAGNDFWFELSEGLKKSRVWNSLKDHSFLPKCGEGLTRGVLPEKLGGGVQPTSQNPYPIYDQNLQNSLPYL